MYRYTVNILASGERRDIMWNHRLRMNARVIGWWIFFALQGLFVKRINALVARCHSTHQTHGFVHTTKLTKLRYKTNCDSEPVIPHYIAGVGRKYIFHIGSVAAPFRQYVIYFLPTSRQYNVESPAQNRN